MARFSLASSFSLLLAVLITTVSSDPIAPDGAICPTITKTTSRPGCPPPTPSVCAQPACILLSTILNPCACPTAVPTSTSYTECPTACHGACGTAYQTYRDCASITLSSSSSIITDPPPSTITPNTHCVTVTDTTGSACPTLGCEVADCIVLSTITQNCGCNEIFHETKCKSKCDGACSTQYKTLYLPCPYTGPFSTQSGTVGPVETLTAL